MNIHELVGATGESPRQIRFMIAEGFMPPPAGGRSNASYGPEHVAAVRAYRRFRSLGFKPAAIKLMRDGTAPVDLPVSPGVVLRLDLAALPENTEPRRVADLVAEILADFTRKEQQNRADADNRP